MKTKKSILQSNLLMAGMVLGSVLLIYQVYNRIQIFMFQLQRANNAYVGWDVDSSTITIARLLALDNIMPAKWAAVLDAGIGLIQLACNCAIFVILAYYILKNRKHHSCFTKHNFNYIRIAILLMLLYPLIILVVQTLLLLILQPPVSWSNIASKLLNDITGLTFQFIIFYCLIHLWNYGHQLQQDADETI